MNGWISALGDPRRDGSLSRLLCRLVVLSVALLCAAAPSAGADATVTPANDTYVDASAPAARHAGASLLAVDGAPVRRTLLRFRVPAGIVTGATLRVYATTRASAPLAVRSASCSWNTKTVAWRSRPRLGSVLGRKAAVAAGWNAIPLRASAVRGERTLCVQVTKSGASRVQLHAMTNRNPARLRVGTAGAPARVMATSPAGALGTGPASRPSTAPATPSRSAPTLDPISLTDPTPAPVPPTTGPQLYASPGGSGSGPCTSPSLPCTLARAQAVATEGTTVNLAAGNYGQFTFNKAGSAGAPIRYVSSTKWGARFTGPAAPGMGGAITMSAQYVSVESTEVTGGRVAVSMTASNTSFIGNHVHDVCLFEPGSNGGAAIDVYTGDYGPLTGVVVDRNIVHDVGPGIAANQSVQGIYVAIPCQGCRVTNSLVYRVTDYGLHAYHNPAYWTYANNTIVGNGRGILAGPQFTVVNNISYGNRGQDYAVATAQSGIIGAPTFVANLTFANGSRTERTGVRLADPLFANAAANDYRPRPGSPAIDQGATQSAPALDVIGVARPTAGAVDIGAYER